MKVKAKNPNNLTTVRKKHKYDSALFLLTKKLSLSAESDDPSAF